MLLRPRTAMGDTNQRCVYAEVSPYCVSNRSFSRLKHSGEYRQQQSSYGKLYRVTNMCRSE